MGWRVQLNQLHKSGMHGNGHDKCQNLHLSTVPLADVKNFRTFAGPEDSWVVSFPVIASILCLLKKPNQSNHSSSDLEFAFGGGYSNRDLSWCLDSMQGFCRSEGPEGGRDLSFGLGTSSDCWLHLHFILNTFHLDSDDTSYGPSWLGSGMRCDRRRIKVQVQPGSDMTFREGRTWIGMRIATDFHGQAPTASPPVVGVIVTDSGASDINLTERDWDQRGLTSPPLAAGVALFQMTLWSSLDWWEMRWHHCLDQIDNVIEVKVRCVEPLAACRIGC